MGLSAAEAVGEDLIQGWPCSGLVCVSQISAVEEPQVKDPYRSGKRTTGR